jgi:predicted transcriptional regulator of viral defense system
MKPSPKQQVILKTLVNQREISLGQAVRLIGGNIYFNKTKHVGTILSNMVKRGMIQRIRPGVFALPAQPPADEFSLSEP